MSNLTASFTGNRLIERLTPLSSPGHLPRYPRVFHWGTGSDHYQGLAALPYPSLLLSISDLRVLGQFLSEYVSTSDLFEVSSTDESTIEHISTLDSVVHDLLIHLNSPKNF